MGRSPPKQPGTRPARGEDRVGRTGAPPRAPRRLAHPLASAATPDTYRPRSHLDHGQHAAVRAPPGPPQRARAPLWHGCLSPRAPAAASAAAASEPLSVSATCSPPPRAASRRAEPARHDGSAAAPPPRAGAALPPRAQLALPREADDGGDVDSGGLGAGGVLDAGVSQAVAQLLQRLLPLAQQQPVAHDGRGGASEVRARQPSRRSRSRSPRRARSRSGGRERSRSRSRSPYGRGRGSPPFAAEEGRGPARVAGHPRSLAHDAWAGPPGHVRADSPMWEEDDRRRRERTSSYARRARGPDEARGGAYADTHDFGVDAWPEQQRDAPPRNAVRGWADAHDEEESPWAEASGVRGAAWDGGARRAAALDAGVPLRRRAVGEDAHLDWAPKRAERGVEAARAPYGEARPRGHEAAGPDAEPAWGWARERLGASGGAAAADVDEAQPRWRRRDGDQGGENGRGRRREARSAVGDARGSQRQRRGAEDRELPAGLGYGALLWDSSPAEPLPPPPPPRPTHREDGWERAGQAAGRGRAGQGGAGQAAGRPRAQPADEPVAYADARGSEPREGEPRGRVRERPWPPQRRRSRSVSPARLGSGSGHARHALRRERSEEGGGGGSALRRERRLRRRERSDGGGDGDYSG
jgi:hypothetical protein